MENLFYAVQKLCIHVQCIYFKVFSVCMLQWFYPSHLHYLLGWQSSVYHHLGLQDRKFSFIMSKLISFNYININSYKLVINNQQIYRKKFYSINSWLQITERSYFYKNETYNLFPAECNSFSKLDWTRFTCVLLLVKPPLYATKLYIFFLVHALQYNFLIETTDMKVVRCVVYTIFS